MGHKAGAMNHVALQQEIIPLQVVVPGLRQQCPRGVSFTHPWDLEESPRMGPRACVLEGTDYCTGRRKEALVMET